MALPFIPYTHQSINEADRQAVADALKADMITRGSQVQAFEKAIADYCGARYAVAFNSGTSALQAAYFAAKMSPYDRFISTPNTFVATVGAAMQLGAHPEFVDIDRRTGNLDLNHLSEKLHYRSSRGKLAIFPVHFSGIPVDMQALDQQLNSPDIIVVEDAAHALGSTYSNGQKVGCCAWSHLTIFSFHPAKTITTGEGGMVTTNDDDLYHRLCLFRNNGIEREAPYLQQLEAPGYYEVQTLTGNYNFTDFQAALGLSQLKRIEEFVQKRRHLVQIYRDKLKGIPHLTMFTDEYDVQSACHLFVVQIDFDAYGTTRERVMNELRAQGIGTQVHYIPVYQHPFFSQSRGDISFQFPEMNTYYARALSLPLYYDLSEKELLRVCKTLKAILKKKKG